MVGTCEKNDQRYGVLGILDGKKAWNKKAMKTKEMKEIKRRRRFEEYDYDQILGRNVGQKRMEAKWEGS